MFRTLGPALALLGGLAAGASPLAAAAQIVPPLVEYPVVRSSACATDAGTGFSEIRRATYLHGRREDAVLVFDAPSCAADALLFTVSPLTGERRLAVTPTSAGVAVLQSRCSAYEWKAGIVQSVEPADCAPIVPVLAVLQR